MLRIRQSIDLFLVELLLLDKDTGICKCHLLRFLCIIKCVCALGSFSSYNTEQNGKRNDMHRSQLGKHVLHAS
jgi:hypothetical protein